MCDILTVLFFKQDPIRYSIIGDSRAQTYYYINPETGWITIKQHLTPGTWLTDRVIPGSYLLRISLYRPIDIFLLEKKIFVYWRNDLKSSPLILQFFFYSFKSKFLSPCHHNCPNLYTFRYLQYS